VWSVKIGLTNEEINILKVVEFKSDKSNDHPRCEICLTELEEGDEILDLPICPHVFHKDCIRKWLSQSPTCPICRQRLR